MAARGKPEKGFVSKLEADQTQRTAQTLRTASLEQSWKGQTSLTVLQTQVSCLASSITCMLPLICRAGTEVSNAAPGLPQCLTTVRTAPACLPSLQACHAHAACTQRRVQPVGVVQLPNESS